MPARRKIQIFLFMRLLKGFEDISGQTSGHLETFLGIPALMTNLHLQEFQP